MGGKDKSLVRKTKLTDSKFNSRINYWFLSFQMVQAIQVLRFHLLELEKVRIYCFVTSDSHYLG